MTGSDKSFRSRATLYTIIICATGFVCVDRFVSRAVSTAVKAWPKADAPDFLFTITPDLKLPTRFEVQRLDET